MSFVIYAIIDPITSQLMYIGQTRRLKRRISEYLHNSKIRRTSKSKIYAWIRNILSQNTTPIFIIIEEVPEARLLNLREIFWINKLTPPLNTTAGGTYGSEKSGSEPKYKYDLDKIKEMLENGATVKDLALLVGCRRSTMAKFMRNNGLRTKNSLNCNPDGSFKSIPSRQVISKDELIELYTNQLLTCLQISEIKNCSSQAIKAWLRKYDIPRRKQNESLKIRYDRGMKNGFRDHNAKGEKI